VQRRAPAGAQHVGQQVGAVRGQALVADLGQRLLGAGFAGAGVPQQARHAFRLVAEIHERL
jgi:hypothetical protein